MGRQTPEQKAFVRKHISSYIHYADGKNLGEFWPGIMEEWFRTWPLSDPPADLVEKAGSLENAQKAWKRKKVEKLKRTFRTAGNDNSTSSRRDLHLEDNPTRKKSEVQMYMVLYYDSRIRQTVLERWAEGHVGVESRVESTIPDGDIEPHESCIYRDAKIPITFKNAVAQELFENETVAIKAEVRSKREEGTVKTVYNTRGDQRMELIHDYQRNIPVLGRNVVNVLKNAEKKCCAKGITWLACPIPSNGGKPVAYFQCVGETARGEDFESFIGVEKAKEFKALFSLWIHKIYPQSEWSLFSIEQLPEDDGDPEDTITGAGSEETPSSAMDTTTSLQPTTAQPTITQSAAAQPAASPEIGSAVTRPATVQQAVSPEIEFTITQPAAAQPVISPGFEFNVDSLILPDVFGHTSPRNEGQVLSTHTSPDPDPLIALGELPLGAEEAAWMKPKKTLKYFREVHRPGKLSDLIVHWYQLEEALGFPESTPKGFPCGGRPKVIYTFFKNGHNYKKDYGLEATTLGTDIAEWWDQIKSTESVCSGGPIGVYVIVVLMCWWCKLLRGQPDVERTDYLRILEEINRAILTAVHNTKNRPTKSSLDEPSLDKPSLDKPSLDKPSLGTPAIPPPQTRGAKRVASGGALSRKRSRRTKA